MVCACCVVDELDAVVGYVGVERARGRPGEGSAVGVFFDDWVEGFDVFAGAAEEDEGDGAGGCGLLKMLVLRFEDEMGRGKRKRGNVRSRLW